MRRLANTSAILLAALLNAASLGGAAADENVQFESATYPPTPYRAAQALKEGKKPERLPGQPLKGRLKKPDGEGPFPAIVLLHGCGGIWSWNDVWSERLVNWGYVVLDVDSFGPRGETSICNRPGTISGPIRALDAHGAKTFLAGMPLVDPDRIGVLGMSHGGWATLHAIQRETTVELGLEPFGAAVALYPSCDGPYELDAPLLIATGELDDWSPVELCERFAASAGSSGEVTLKVYPGAYHLFDLKGVDTQQEGHILRYDPKAADDAIERIAEFLAKHL